MRERLDQRVNPQGSRNGDPSTTVRQAPAWAMLQSELCGDAKRDAEKRRQYNKLGVLFEAVGMMQIITVASAEIVVTGTYVPS